MDRRMLLWSALLVGLTTTLSAAPAETDNAATFYRQAFQVLPDTSNPEWAILDNPDAVKLDATAIEFIRKHDATFELLHKGAAIRRCDWGVDPAKGTAAKLPHLAPARTLSNLTRLRARYLFQQQQHGDAMNDVVALLTLSRHIGADPFIIAKFMEAGIADSAVAAAAQGLATTPPEVARKLMEGLERLPTSLPASEVVRREGASVAAELERASGGDAGRKAVAGEVAALFEEAAKHLALPFEQSFAPMQKWETRREGSSATVQQWVPSLRKYRVGIAAAETRVEMLYAGAAVRIDGPREIFRFNEPHAKGPFTCREIPGGFELESKLVVNNVPLRLTCKPTGDEIPF